MTASSVVEVAGDLFEADVDALVNAVNCVGVMGKGIAAQFRARFHDNYVSYQQACRTGLVVPGRALIEPVTAGSVRWVVNLPTKRHWRDPSRLEDVAAALTDLAERIPPVGIRSLAVPALGCGLGGLDWATVRPLIVDTLAPTGVRLLLYPPQPAPARPVWPVFTGTGHRDLEKRFNPAQMARLRREIRAMVCRLRDEHGARVGISGLAIGYDTILAEEILDAGLQLWAYRPGPWQPSRRWTPEQVATWEGLCARAIVRDFSGSRYDVSAYHTRDRAMVDDSDIVTTCWYADRFDGGTYKTLLHAVRRRRPIIHVDPTVAEDAPAVRLPRADTWRTRLRIKQQQPQPSLLDALTPTIEPSRGQ